MNEEGDEGKDGEGGEAGGGDVQGGVVPGDAIDLEEVLGLGGVGGLPEGQLFVGGVDGVRPHEEGGAGDLLAHQVGEVAPAAGGVGLGGDGEGAGLVLAEVVVGLPPPAVLLARRRVAEPHLDLLVRRVGVGREALVQRPAHRDGVHPRPQHCRRGASLD